MRIVVKKDRVDVIITAQEKAKLLASGRWKTDAGRAVADAGRQTKTKVQTAVHRQMAIKSKGKVISGTRGRANLKAMTYEIWAVPGGQPIEEYKGLRALVPSGAAARRLNAGQDPGTVRSGVWNRPRIFQRSFAAGGGYFAFLPPSAGTRKVAPKALWTYGSKKGQPRDSRGRFEAQGIQYGKIRSLFGPSQRNEIGEGESLATFQREGSRLLLEKVTARIEKILDL